MLEKLTLQFSWQTKDLQQENELVRRASQSNSLPAKCRNPSVSEPKRYYTDGQELAREIDWHLQMGSASKKIKSKNH